MDFSLLGPVEASQDGQRIPLGGPRQRALLARLLVDANRVVPADRLVADLWDAPPHDAQAALQNQVSRLRKVVGDRLVTKPPGYLIRVEPGELDLEEFRSRVAEAGGLADPRERSRVLREADSLFQGPPLADVDAPFAETERGALEELRLAAIEGRVDADLERGRHAELVPELGALVRAHPLRERLRGQLILALYRSGRQADALEAYRDAKRMLDEELGLEPNPTLRELERAILTQDESLAAPAALAAEAVPEPLAESIEPAPAWRRRAPLVAVGLVAVGAATAAAVALTSRTGGTNEAARTSVVRVVTHRVVTGPSHVVARRTRRHPRARTATRSVTTVSAKPTPAPPPATTQPKPAARQSTTTTPAVRKPTKPPAPVQATISDTFDGDVIDPTIWHTVMTDSNVSLAQNGQLVVTVGANAQRAGTYDQIDAHVGTQCSFPGDFDARVDYTLLEWPQNANILIGMNAIYTSSFAGRQSRTQSGDTYVGWVASNFGSVPLPETQGSLRIARVHGIATSYFWHEGHWVRLASGVSTGAAVIGLGAQSSSADTEFNGQEVKVAFDNFKVRAVDPTGGCRTG